MDHIVKFCHLQAAYLEMLLFHNHNNQHQTVELSFKRLNDNLVLTYPNVNTGAGQQDVPFLFLLLRLRLPFCNKSLSARNNRTASMQFIFTEARPLLTEGASFVQETQ